MYLGRLRISLCLSIVDSLIGRKISDTGPRSPFWQEEKRLWPLCWPQEGPAFLH